MKRNPIYYFLLIFTLIPLQTFANGSAGSEATYEPRRIVDMPTAGVIPKGHFEANSFLMQSGGLMAEFLAAPFKNFTVGISFGGQDVIGVSSPKFQEYPGVQAKYRIIDETTEFPAIAVGYNSQGMGLYSEKENRYQTLSPGGYLAVSKSFLSPIGLSFVHAGVNYSFEPKADHRSVNFYLGAEQTIFSRISVGTELNLNLENNSAFLENNGLLNFQFKWAASEDLTVMLMFRDAFANFRASESLVRFLRFEYINRF